MSHGFWSGRDRATSLVPILEGLGVTDLLSADLAACVDMLTPFATATGLNVRRETQLTLAGFAGNEINVADRAAGDDGHEGRVVAIASLPRSRQCLRETSAAR